MQQVVDILPDSFPNAKQVKSLALDFNKENMPIEIPPGTTLALFGTPGNIHVAMAMPVLTKKGKPVPAKKLLKGIQAALKSEWKMVTEEEDGGFFVVGPKGQENYNFHFRAATDSWSRTVPAFDHSS